MVDCSAPLFAANLNTALLGGHHPPMPSYVVLIYLAAAMLFALSLKWLSTPRTARAGVLAGEIGMAAAIIATLFLPEVRHYQWILVAGLIGIIAAIPMAMLVPMTAVPQQIAMFHAFGALAAALVGTAEYYAHGGDDARLAGRC